MNDSKPNLVKHRADWAESDPLNCRNISHVVTSRLVGAGDERWQVMALKWVITKDLTPENWSCTRFKAIFYWYLAAKLHGVTFRTTVIFMKPDQERSKLKTWKSIFCLWRFKSRCRIQNAACVCPNVRQRYGLWEYHVAVLIRWTISTWRRAVCVEMANWNLTDWLYCIQSAVGSSSCKYASSYYPWEG